MNEKKGKFRYGKMLGVTTLVVVLALSIFGVCREISLESAQRNLKAMLEAEQGNYNEDRVVLASTNKRDAQEMADVFGGTLRITDNEQFAVINLPDGVTLTDIAENEEYRKYHGDILLDYNNFSIAEEDTDVVSDTEIRSSYQVNDPMYHQQTYIDYLNIGDTWNLTRGTYNDGEKVTVAVIDTGIDTDHPEFVDADGNSIISTSSYDATNDKVVDQYDINVIEDTHGHGTAVAGVIAAQMNEVGIAGITPDVELLVIKCENDEAGEFKSSADIVFAVYYAIEKEADVINMSLGGNGSEDMAAAIQLAVDCDIMCIASAGNDSTDKDHYPAAYENVIGVGALAEGSWEIADYSNYGVNSDIMAPGNALTTDIDGGYSYSNGTSIAAPMVSAAVAMYVAQNKYVNYEDLRADLLAAGKDLGDAGEDHYYGFGAIDVAAFVCEEKGLITYDYCTEEIEATSQVFVRQHTIQTIPEPERENVVFDDWYYDKSYTRVFDYELWYSTEFVEDITLYAKWVNEDDEGTSGYNYKTLSDGTIEITGYKGKRRYLTIPEEIDGKIVSSIGKGAFVKNKRLKEVVFPTGLIYIKEGAFSYVENMRRITFTGENLAEVQKKSFYKCKALRSLELPDSVAVIGESAFEGCTSMRTVNISENSSLSSIGGFAFSETDISSFYIPTNVSGFGGSVLAGCSNMSRIAVNSNNSAFKVEDNTVYNMDKTEIVYYPSALTGTYQVADEVRVVLGYAFTGSKVTAVNLNSVEKIGYCAFASTKKISQIVLPDSVFELGDYAFSNSSIAHIMLSENLSKISEGAFCDTKLTEIYVPEKVEIIESNAFARCSYLKQVTFAENSKLREIKGGKGKGAFWHCYILENFILPNSIENIGEEAFFYCSGITKIEIPVNVVTIGKSAFRCCSKLQTISFAEGCQLKNIPEYCFAYCTTLSKVDFSANIVKLGKSAFSNDYLLRELNFSVDNELTTIDDYCFYSCSMLQAMQIPESVTNIGEFAYAFSGLKKVEISRNVISIENAAFGACYALTGFDVDESNAIYAAVDNVLFSKDISSVYCVPASRVGSYSLPETVTTVAPYSFYYDILLTGVLLPDNLCDIQQNAFYNCSSLVSIEIPANVSYIGRNTFENCGKLNSVTFGRGSKLERLGIYTFVNCGLSEITIPASIKEMAQYVFYGCNKLTKITFEKGSQLTYIASYLFKETSIQNVIFEEGSALTSLQAHAFDGASYLTSVDFGDAKLTNIDNYAFYGCSKLAEIDLPDTITYIGRYAFYGCLLLERIDIPEVTEFIGQYAFCDTNSIKVFFLEDVLPAYVETDWDKGIAGYFLGAVDYIVTDEWEYSVCSDGTIALAVYKGKDSELVIDTVDGYTVSKIGVGCFKDYDTLISISLNENIEEIGNYAFCDCDALNEINLPASVERIGDYAFANSIAVVSLEERSELNSIGSYAFSSNPTERLELPNSVATIGEGAFYDSALSVLSIEVGSSLRTIGQQAFIGSNLTSIYLPETLQSVGVEAFKNVSALTEIIIAGGETLLKLSNSAFEGCGVEEITIPARVYYIGEYTLGSCSNMQNIYVDSESVYYSSLDGVLCDIKGTTLLQYPCGRSGAYEVPAQITVLNYKSFKDATALTEITFAEGNIIKTIGWQTFSGCEKLQKITIPDSVVSFDFYSFENCSSLTSVILSENSQLIDVYEGAFYNCSLLENISLPDFVVEIGEYAFYNCSSMKTFPLTENALVKGIYDYAFYGCSGITEIPTLLQLAEIGKYAFAYTNISEYTISESINDVAGDAFVGCKNLKTLKCDEQNTEYTSIQGVIYEKDAKESDYDSIMVWPYGKVLIVGEGKEEITSEDTMIIYKIPKVQFEIADTVVSIGSSAFEDYTDLSSIDLSNILSIGDYAFKGCVGLRHVKLSENLSSIGIAAFSGCKRLENITIPENIASVGDYVFNGCTDLRSVKLSENLSSIGIAAFSGCKRLEKITIPENVSSIGNHAFNGCLALSDITIPENVTKIGEAAFFRCSKVENIYYNAIAAEDVKYIYGANVFAGSSIFDGVGKDVKETNLIIGQKVTKIPAGLFFSDNNIINVVFEEGSVCRGIGACAFYNSYIKSINLPEGLQSIGNLAFSGCSKLEKIIVPESVTDIVTSAFFGCNKLKTAGPIGGGYDYEFGWKEVIPDYAFDGCQGLCEVVLPEGLVSIGVSDTVFRECMELISLRIPKSVKKISKSAFGGSDGIKVVQVESPEMIRNIESGSSYGYLFLDVDTIVIPCEIADIGSYITNNFTEIDTININGDEYVSYSNHIHEWNSSEIISEYVECQQDGLKKYNCVKCGLLNYEISPAHNYIVEITEATCTNEGYATYTCLNCQNNYSEILDKLEHEYGEWCNVSTEMSQKKCKNCDAYVTGNFTTVASGECGDNVNWVLKASGELWIYGTGVIANKSSYSSVPWYTYRNKITSINMDENITSIGNYAFYGCTKLTLISIPKGVTQIGTYAFYGCTGLQDIVIPDSVTEIGAYTFYNCKGLTEITLPTNLKSISSNLFRLCSKLTNVIIPDTVAGIEESAFDNCTSLIGVTIPENTTYIERYAFRNCLSLENLDIPNNVTQIGDYAFYDCDGLKEIKIGKGVLEIGSSNVFGGCDNLEYISVAGENKVYCSVEGVLFNKTCTKILAVPAGLAGDYFIPDTVTNIGSYTFYGCKKLTNISIPNSVTQIENYAFYLCTKLNTISVPDSVVNIGNYAFAMCSALDDFYIPDSVKEINYYLFMGCTSLSAITIPEGITHIYSGSFMDCTSLKDITLPESITYIGSDTFSGCTSLKGIILPNSVGYVENSLFYNCKSLSNIILPENYTSIGQWAFYGCTSLSSIIIPENVKSIGKYSFSGCTSLSSIIIPENVKSIGKYSFNGCTNLNSITIPENVENIEEGTFNGCTSLNSITIPKNVKSISNSSFYKCMNLKYIYFLGDAVEIATNAFYKVTAFMYYPANNETWTDDIMQNYSGTLTWVSVCDGHEFGEWYDFIQKTCIKDGEQRRECEHCDYFETKEIEATGHAYEEIVTEPTCEEAGYTTHICSVCGNSYVDSEVEALGHELGNWITTKEASCTKAGEAKRSCERCDYSETKEIKATGHVYEEMVTSPTCEERGYTTHTCSTCGDSYVDSEVEVLGHKLGEWTTVKEASCTEAGEEKRSCDRCDYFETKVVEATGHKYEEVVTAPTCEEAGDTTHTCSTCGDSYVDSEVKALGHKLGEWTTIKEASCTEAGEAKRECARCDYFETKEVEGVGHNLGEWTTIKEASCTEAGEAKRGCTRCDHYETKVIEATGHAYEEVVTEPTCEEAGYTTHICSVCGNSYVDSEVEALGHELGNWITTKEASCTKAGEAKRSCERCDYSETKEIKATGHVYEEMVTSPTCEERGYTTHTCSTCGDSYVDSEVEVLGHKLGEWTTVKEASCTEAGEEKRSCDRCDYFETKVVEATGHKYEEVVTAPTCEEAGDTTHTCSTCGDSYVDSEVKALGHKLGEWTTIKEASCTEAGEKKRSCVRCDYFETRESEMTGHTYEEVITDPTCEEGGYTTHTCSTCSDSYIDNEVEELGHSFTSYISDNNATTESAGTLTATCDRCDATDTITDPAGPIIPDIPIEPETGEVVRLFGTTRYETSYKVADVLKEQLGVEKFDAVVVATGKNFADALSGSYLAMMKKAPIILTNGKNDNIATLHEYILENVTENGTIYILGGEAAVPESVEAIEGFTVRRLSGSSRYDTNLAILEEAGMAGDELIVATGKSFADSLSASAAKLPILLVKPGKALSDDAKAIVEGVNKIYIIGGEGAVSKEIEEELMAYGEVERVFGNSRYETSVAVAQAFFGDFEKVVIASGKNFPDGLCGGPLAATINAPLILTSDGKTGAAATFIQGQAVDAGYVLGGTGAIGDSSVEEIFK